MDRSFLSQPEVIEASRHFVCIRLATYEDETEAAFLKSFNVTRSGELENSVFAILSPDGQRQLVRASRSIRHSFDDAQQMAKTMVRLAEQLGQRAQPQELPYVASVRLALDVAACDNQPLVILLARDDGLRREGERRLAELAWRDEFIGRCVYTSTMVRADLDPIKGVTGDSAILVVQPDQFGVKGTVLKQIAADAPGDRLAIALREGLSEHRRIQKTFANHVRAGQEEGIFWETAVPVTDPMELQARERGRSRRPPDR